MNNHPSPRPSRQREGGPNDELSGWGLASHGIECQSEVPDELRQTEAPNGSYDLRFGHCKERHATALG